MGLTFLLCRVVVIALGHLRTSALGQLQFEADCMYFFFLKRCFPWLGCKHCIHCYLGEGICVHLFKQYLHGSDFIKHITAISCRAV